MTYRPGDTVSASDYNALIGNLASDQPAASEADAAGRLAAIWGVGWGRYGFGQRSEPWRLRLQSPSTRVLADDWFRLQDALARLLAHMGTTSPDLPSASAFGAGDRILVHDAGYAPGDFDAVVPVVDDPANRTKTASDNIASYIVDVNVVTDTRGYTWGLSGENFASSEVALIWSDGDAARAFWNAGGEIWVRVSHPSGSADDNLMRDFLATIGTFKYQRDRCVHTGTATPVSPGPPPGGYWNATVYSPPYFSDVSPAFRDTSNPWPNDDLRAFFVQNAWQKVNVSGHGDNGSIHIVGVVVARVTPSTDPTRALSPGTRAEWDPRPSRASSRPVDSPDGRALQQLRLRRRDRHAARSLTSRPARGNVTP